MDLGFEDFPEVFTSKSLKVGQRGLDAYSILLSITCPMIFSCRYLAKIEKHKHYIGHICLCGTKSENFPLLKIINIISIHIYNKIIV